MSVPFTQYLRPNGEPKKTTLNGSLPETDILAQEFIKAGGKFECEVLVNGIVSLTACYKVDRGELGKEWEDIAIELVENGPKVLAAVDKLVKDATEFLKGL